MNYYVDSLLGDDRNDGLSRQTAFKTLEKVNSFPFSGGDNLYFKAGCTFEGSLKPIRKGGGVIRIDRYGVGENPLISGNSDVALDICDISEIEVENIAVTNPKGRYGIRVYNDKGGEMKHIHVKNCYVYDVNGGHDEFWIVTGGIIITTGTKNPGWFNDLLIEDNRIDNVCRTGIILIPMWSNRPIKTYGVNDYIDDKTNWYPCYGVVFRGNYVTRPAGDGIVLIGAIDPLMEWNTVYGVMSNPKPPCANAGIWPQATENCIVQYNEVGYSNKPAGCDDAQGFDVDLSCRNTIIQYNYSHDNEGGFLLLCEISTIPEDHDFTGTIVRNNLSVNDGNTKGELFALVGPVKGASIENNTIYSSGNVDRIVEVWSADGLNQASDVTFKNNIFISNGRNNGFNLKNGKKFQFDSNLYWGTHKTVPADHKNPIVIDPKLKLDGKSGKGRLSAVNYLPLEDAEILKCGIKSETAAKEDFFGNKAESIYLGAFSRSKRS